MKTILLVALLCSPGLPIVTKDESFMCPKKSTIFKDFKERLCSEFTCRNKCNESQVETMSRPEDKLKCFCDEDCLKYSDCCSDFSMYCPETYAAATRNIDLSNQVMVLCLSGRQTVYRKHPQTTTRLTSTIYTSPVSASTQVPRSSLTQSWITPLIALANLVLDQTYSIIYRSMQDYHAFAKNDSVPVSLPLGVDVHILSPKSTSGFMSYTEDIRYRSGRSLMPVGRACYAMTSYVCENCGFILFKNVYEFCDVKTTGIQHDGAVMVNEESTASPTLKDTVCAETNISDTESKVKTSTERTTKSKRKITTIQYPIPRKRTGRISRSLQKGKTKKVTEKGHSTMCAMSGNDDYYVNLATMTVVKNVNENEMIVRSDDLPWSVFHCSVLCKPPVCLVDECAKTRVLSDDQLSCFIPSRITFGTEEMTITNFSASLTSEKKMKQRQELADLHTCFILKELLQNSPVFQLAGLFPQEGCSFGVQFFPRGSNLYSNIMKDNLFHGSASDKYTESSLAANDDDPSIFNRNSFNEKKTRGNLEHMNTTESFRVSGGENAENSEPSEITQIWTTLEAYPYRTFQYMKVCLVSEPVLMNCELLQKSLLDVHDACRSHYANTDSNKCENRFTRCFLHEFSPSHQASRSTRLDGDMIRLKVIIFLLVFLVF